MTHIAFVVVLRRNVGCHCRGRRRQTSALYCADPESEYVNKAKGIRLRTLAFIFADISRLVSLHNLHRMQAYMQCPDVRCHNENVVPKNFSNVLDKWTVLWLADKTSAVSIANLLWRVSVTILSSQQSSLMSKWTVWRFQFMKHRSFSRATRWLMILADKQC